MKDLWVKPVPGTQEAFKKHLLAYGHQEGKAGGGAGVGERRRGMNWETGIDMYTLICIK